MKLPHLPRVFTWTPLMLIECAIARWVYVDLIFAYLIGAQLLAFLGLCWVDLSINHHRAKLNPCAAGDHNWRTLNEQDSIQSVFCDMRNVPSRCADCGEFAYTDWVHGKGITQWRRIPDEDLSDEGLAARAASKLSA